MERFLLIEQMVLRFKNTNSICIYDENSVYYQSDVDGIIAYPYLTFASKISSHTPENIFIDIIYTSDDNFMYLVTIKMESTTIVSRECRRMLILPFIGVGLYNETKKIIMEKGIICFKDDTRYLLK